MTLRLPNKAALDKLLDGNRQLAVKDDGSGRRAQPLGDVQLTFLPALKVERKGRRARRPAKGQTEHDAQVVVFRWIDANVTRYPQLRMALAVPNGAKLPYITNKKGKRYSPEAIRLKAEGLRPGVPDIILLAPSRVTGRLYHGLAIELKVGRNETSEAQDGWLERLTYYGYLVGVCYGADQAIALICAYLGIERNDS